MLSSSLEENIRITTSPIAIVDSMYDPTIVPDAKPNAYPTTRNGLSKSLITCDIATTQIADSIKPNAAPNVGLPLLT